MTPVMILDLLVEEQRKLNEDPTYLGGGDDPPYGPILLAYPEQKFLGQVSRFAYLDMLCEEYDYLILNNKPGRVWPKRRQ